MERQVADKKKRRKIALIELAVYFGIALTAFCLVFFIRRLFTASGLSDAFFVAGASVLFLALMRLVIRSGLFDLPAFGVRRLVETIFTPKRKKYDDMIEYSDAKKEKRARSKMPYWPAFAIGGALVIAAMILMFVARANRPSAVIDLSAHFLFIGLTR